MRFVSFKQSFISFLRIKVHSIKKYAYMILDRNIRNICFTYHYFIMYYSIHIMKYIYIYIYIYIYYTIIFEKSVGTTELHYSTKKREHCFSILSMLKQCSRFFVL